MNTNNYECDCGKILDQLCSVIDENGNPKVCLYCEDCDMAFDGETGKWAYDDE